MQRLPCMIIQRSGPETFWHHNQAERTLAPYLWDPDWLFFIGLIKLDKIFWNKRGNRERSDCTIQFPTNVMILSLKGHSSAYRKWKVGRNLIRSIGVEKQLNKNGAGRMWNKALKGQQWNSISIFQALSHYLSKITVVKC